LAAFREFFEEWNENLRRYFVPIKSLVVDEQLVSSRCRSPNKIYNPSKPGKYGELVRWCADAEFRYFLNGNPLTRRPEDASAATRHKENNSAKNLVLDLTGPFLDRGRNITGDRFFSSTALAHDLLTRRTTYVGTIMKGKRELPPILHEPKNQYQSEFVFGGNEDQITLQSYQVKRSRKAYLISTMHHDRCEGNPDNNNKSDIQLFYNSTKAGVDVVDQMCKRFSTRCKVHRWPTVHFHNILDVTGVNSQTIFTELHPEWCRNRRVTSRTVRREFLIELATQLAMPNMRLRLNDPIGLTRPIVDNLARLTGMPNPRGDRESTEDQFRERGRCARCRGEGKKSRACNRTKDLCISCNQPVCGKHSTSVKKCVNCA
jgi:hypothetical protein